MSATHTIQGDDRVRRAVSVFFNPLVKQQHARVDAGTRWGLSASGALHALFFAWLILLWRPEPPAVAQITEISYLAPGDLDGTPSPARTGSSAAPAASPGQLAPGEQDVHFKRESKSSDLSLDPQSSSALEDRLNARLATLQSASDAPSAGLVTSAPPSLWGSTPATVSGSGSGGSAPVALKRGGAGSAPPPSLELNRGGHDIAPALVTSTTAAERAESQAPARGGESTARRTLAGATIMGPIADRAIIAHTTPVYPDWAKREAVEGSVTLYFVVRADGTVKENILVQKTAGFEEFDENARAALAAWRFEPLRDGRTGEQWGNITFHFRLRGGV